MPPANAGKLREQVYPGAWTDDIEPQACPVGNLRCFLLHQAHIIDACTPEASAELIDQDEEQDHGEQEADEPDGKDGLLRKGQMRCLAV